MASRNHDGIQDNDLRGHTPRKTTNIRGISPENVESGGGAVPLEFGAFSRSLSRRRYSPVLIGPFPPPARRTRTCGFPASGSPVGACTSHTKRQFGAASSHAGRSGTEGFACPRLSEAARLHPQCSSPTHRQACSRPDGTEPPTSGRPDSFASACDASGLLLPALVTRGNRPKPLPQACTLLASLHT